MQTTMHALSEYQALRGSKARIQATEQSPDVEIRDLELWIQMERGG